MKASYYFKRIMNDKTKLFFIILLFTIPMLDLILTFINVPMGAYPERADVNTFLYGSYVHNHFSYPLMLYFLPVYLLIVAGEDCFEDVTTGYRNVLISKWGKKNYVKTNIIKAFCISFSVIFISLLLNLLMAHIIYSGSEYSQIEELLVYYEPGDLYYIEAKYPLLTNFIYLFPISFMSGMLGSAGAALAMAIKNRKIVYPLLFLLWFILFLPRILAFDDIIMLAMQPFNETSLDTKVLIFVITSCIFVAVTVAAAVKEIRYEKV